MPANNPFSDAINSVIQEYERHTETTRTKKVPAVKGRDRKIKPASRTRQRMEEFRLLPPSGKRMKNYRDSYVS